MVDWLAPLHFEFPGYLALCALVPLLLALGLRSLSGLDPLRRTLAMLVRCAVVLVIVLALAGAQRVRRVDDLTVVFLIDRSRSVPAELQRAAFEFVRRASAGRKLDDRIAILAFDGRADVEQLPMRACAIDRINAPLDADQSNLAAAVRLAAAVVPAETRGRLVLLSDGNENAGDVLSEAERLRAARIPIDIVPLRYEHADEVIFESLRAPPNATAEETINLQMVLRSQRAVQGRIELWHNDVLVDLNGPEAGTGFAVELEAGPNRFVRAVPLRAAGAHRFRAQFVPEEAGTDTIEDNNTGEAFTVVSGQGKLLILAGVQDLSSPRPEAHILQRALEDEGLVCDVVAAGEQQLNQVRLLEYSAVVLSNVAAGDLRDEEKKALGAFVRDLGGGLIMIGGDDSFGAGGWRGSEVEEVMPVSFEIRHKKQFIKGALVLVMHACEVEQGNFIGIRCAVEAVKTLGSRDLIGVLAWSWTGAEARNWVVPLQEVGTRTPVLEAIQRMSMGDLPHLDDVMRPGVEALIAREDAGAKHMIVVSDFDPSPPRDDLIAKMADHGITCSTIAIGYGGHFIDEDKARWIAEQTKGRFYRTQDYTKLPQIFVKESREVQRSLIQELPFTPRLNNPLSPVAGGLAGEALPQLGGLVLTTPKPQADLALVRPSLEGDDPVLAAWQVGLGKAVAFTSGLWSRWGVQWVSWPRFSSFWAQVGRWVSRPAEAAAFDVTTTVFGGRAKLRLDALDKNAAAINFMEVVGTLVDPQQQGRALPLVQTGPGRYEAEFDARERGNYIVNLAYRTGAGKEAQRGSLRTGVSIAYSPEFSRLQPNLALLEEIRSRTQGRLLGFEDASAVFDRAGLGRAVARSALWESLLQWVLVLFLLDVAIRRIAVNPIELVRKLRRRMREVAAGGRAAEAAAVLTTLKGTRDRVREEQAAVRAGDAGAGPSPAARFEAAAGTKADAALADAIGGARPVDRPVVARPDAAPAASEEDYTSRLLKAKRRAREDMDQDAPP